LFERLASSFAVCAVRWRSRRVELELEMVVVMRDLLLLLVVVPVVM
jgi:hypothetical protein